MMGRSEEESPQILISIIEEKYANLERKLTSLHSTEDRAALHGIRSRMLALAGHKFAAELFNAHMIKLDGLEQASTLDDAAKFLDQLTAIVNFYETNYSTFSWMIKKKFFIDQLKGGDLEVWEALVTRGISYRRLNELQSTTLVLQVLADVRSERHERAAAWTVPPRQSDHPSQMSIRSAVTQPTHLTSKVVQDTSEQEAVTKKRRHLR